MVLQTAELDVGSYSPGRTFIVCAYARISVLAGLYRGHALCDRLAALYHPFFDLSCRAHVPYVHLGVDPWC